MSRNTLGALLHPVVLSMLLVACARPGTASQWRDAGPGGDGSTASPDPSPVGDLDGVEPEAEVTPTDGSTEAAELEVLGSGPMASSNDPCRTLTPTIRGTDGDDVIRGTDRRDIIFAGSGNDTIWGNGGNDVICAGPGVDVIEAGAGDDYVDGGYANDDIHGGAGADVLHGRSGSDTIHGDAGDDRVFGDILDDHLFGDDGDDLIVGGHGVDDMHGGAGNDWLRGDTNGDDFLGGEEGGQGDTASFMTATPPGQSLGGMPGVEGVTVDNRSLSAGLASGDGANEPLVSIERIVGSAFRDRLLGGRGTRFLGGSAGDDELEAPSDTTLSGGGGADTCNGAPCAGAAGADASRVVVFLSPEPRDTGLVVIGSPGDDSLTISVVAGIAQVRSEPAAPLVGPGCVATADAHLVTCALRNELRYILGYGGDGNDEIALEGRFPRDMEATLDGGRGDDVLRGHEGQDILFAGPTGLDTLEGLGGDDALISESRDADWMDAGAGEDQLVANWPCGGHTYIGGTGQDVAGFARVGNFETAAERRRQGIHARIGGRAWQPSFCAAEQGTVVGADTEILEGAGGDDVLTGSEGPDIIWGREGNDVIRGLGGDDVLEGIMGDDEIHGGAGRDRMRGGEGADRLFARDGEADFVVDPTGAGCVADRDGVDPSGSTCR